MTITRTITRTIQGNVVSHIAQLWFYQSGIALPQPDERITVDSIILTSDNITVTTDALTA